MKALVALLLALNIGFAAWQLTRHEVPPVRRPPADAGVEPLLLLTELAKPLPAKEASRPRVFSPPPVIPEPALP